MINEHSVSLLSTALGREVTYTLFIPETGIPFGAHHLLLLNDGQDAEGLGLRQTLDDLVSSGSIQPVIIAAIVAGERIQEYGVAGRPDFKGRGAKAYKYTNAVLTELLPSIYAEMEADHFASVSVAGCSLGGLTAFDMAWNHPDVFRLAGAFSGSFWWRSRDLGKKYNNATDRIMHQVVKSRQQYHPGQRFWFEVGTEDEKADRNGNGVIDVIDDTNDIIRGLEAKGYQKGRDIACEIIEGGRHDIPTWAVALPRFLTWAFGNHASAENAN